jgi:hypothetical protein
MVVEQVDLSRPCDACGETPVGGGAHCLKCNIYFCFLCMIEYMYYVKELPLKCPMCGGRFGA